MAFYYVQALTTLKAMECIKKCEHLSTLKGMGRSFNMKKKSLLPMNLQFFTTKEGGEGSDPEATPPVTPEIDFDKLTDEQVAEVKAKFGFKTDEEVNDLIKIKKSKWREKTEEEKLQAKKLAEMNEDDKVKYEREQLELKIADFERRENLAKMSEVAADMLTEAGASATKKVLALLVTEEAESTSNNVKAYLEVIDAEREVIKADYEKRLGGRIPLDGADALKLSIGEQYAKEQNEKNKEAGKVKDPWAI